MASEAAITLLGARLELQPERITRASDAPRPRRVRLMPSLRRDVARMSYVA